MLREWQRRICYLLVCILLLAGMHTTYVKADTIAKQAVTVSMKAGSNATIQAVDDRLTQENACVITRNSTGLRSVLAQVRSRSRVSSVRRDLRLPILFLCALCVAYFLLKCWNIEEILCQLEKKYRAALIKYIHDIDGKKRISCLT